MIGPPLSALLADTTGKKRGYERPFLGPVNTNKLFNLLVFLFRPWTLNEGRIENFLPAVKALNVRPPGNQLSDLLPVFSTILLYSISKGLVL